MPREDGHTLEDFQVVNHGYFYRGVRYPGVTTLLRIGGWAGIFIGGGRARADAMRRGTEVHVWAASIDRGDEPDPALIRPETASFLAADATLRATTRFEAIVVEHPLVHPLLHYGGQLDAVVWHHGLRVLIDRKTGTGCPPSGFLQLALYRLMWDFWYPETPVDQTAIVVLRPTGPRYVVDPHPAFTQQVAMAVLWRQQWLDRYPS